MALNINSILNGAIPLLNLVIPGASNVINDLQGFAKGVTFASIEQFATDAEVVALNYLPNDKAIFDQVIVVLKDVDKLIALVETPKP